MKLIYLANIGLPTAWAHGIQIMKMCEAFAGQGLEVELVAPRRRKVRRENPFKFFGVKENFEIKFIPFLDLAPGHSGSLFFRLRLLSFFLVAKIYLMFQRYDILYTRDHAAGLFFKNFYLEVHSMPASIKSWHKKVWRKAQSLIVLTSFIRQELREAGIAGEKILVASDGVDLEKFDIPVFQQEARQKLSLPMDKKIILYAGSFYLRDWKGVDVLLEAAKYLSPDCLLVLVGGQENEIEKIKKNYPAGNILLFGRQPYQKIPLYLKAADILVLPNKKGESISEKYTSPLKLFEYMAAGRPIVASDLPTICEVLNENNSVLVVPNDPDALAGGIKKVLSDAGLSERISHQALFDVKNYTWDNRAKNIINFSNTKT